MTADEHISFVRFALSVFRKGMNNMIALIGDNCSANQSICTKVATPLIGWASHRIQLAVQDILKQGHDVVSVVHRLMLKF